MPITLNDTRTPQTLDLYGATVTYIEAAGDATVKALRRAGREMKEGDIVSDLLINVDVGIAAACVLDWSGFEDHAGTAIPWPGAGKATNAPGRETPTAEELAARVELVRLMPAAALIQLCEAVSRAIRAGADSGKG